MAKKKKKNIAEKIKKFSESIKDFVGGTTGIIKDSSGNKSIIIGKQKKYCSQAEEKKANGGLISGKPKLAKKGWR